MQNYALIGDQDTVTYIGTMDDVRNSEAGLTWVPLNGTHDVKVGYHFCFRSRKFSRIRKSIAEEQDELLIRINQVFRGKMKGLLSGYDEYEIMTFPFQIMAILEEQLGVKDGICGYILKGLSMGRKEEIAETKNAIMKKTMGFVFIAGLLVGTRHDFERKAMLVKDYGQIDELAEHIHRWEQMPIIPEGIS